MLRQCVITCAGYGTRLFPMTKELPKEMLPIFLRARSGQLRLVPILQAIFEQLYSTGLREFCFVIGRGKRAVEDHFTPDASALTILEQRGRQEAVRELSDFSDHVEGSSLVWVNQPVPRGFGEAVLRAEPFVRAAPFLVQAGDTHILSRSGHHLHRLMIAQGARGADAVFLTQRVANPQDYGVVEGRPLSGPIIRIMKVVEKPAHPQTDLAILPVYVFTPAIFDALKGTRPGVAGEVQLTDGIQKLIDDGRKVLGVRLGDREFRLDVGTPETYWECVTLSYERALRLSRTKGS